jgi:hypothetical protein
MQRLTESFHSAGVPRSLRSELPGQVVLVL